MEGSREQPINLDASPQSAREETEDVATGYSANIIFANNPLLNPNVIYGGSRTPASGASAHGIPAPAGAAPSSSYTAIDTDFVQTQIFPFLHMTNRSDVGSETAAEGTWKETVWETDLLLEALNAYSADPKVFVMSYLEAAVDGLRAREFYTRLAQQSTKFTIRMLCLIQARNPNETFMPTIGHQQSLVNFSQARFIDGRVRVNSEQQILRVDQVSAAFEDDISVNTPHLDLSGVHVAGAEGTIQHPRPRPAGIANALARGFGVMSPAGETYAQAAARAIALPVAATTPSDSPIPVSFEERVATILRYQTSQVARDATQRFANSLRAAVGEERTRLVLGDLFCLWQRLQSGQVDGAVGYAVDARNRLVAWGVSSHVLGLVDLLGTESQTAKAANQLTDQLNAGSSRAGAGSGAGSSSMG